MHGKARERETGREWEKGSDRKASPMNLPFEIEYTYQQKSATNNATNVCNNKSTAAWQQTHFDILSGDGLE